MTQDRLKNRCLGSRLADRLPVVPRLSSTDPWFFNLRRIFFLNPCPKSGLAYIRPTNPVKPFLRGIQCLDKHNGEQDSIA